MFEIIAQDAFALSEYEHNEPEPVEIKQLLGVYTEQPSEYKGVSDEVLRGYGVVDWKENVDLNIDLNCF